MSLSFWAQACATAVYKPVQALLDSAYANCGVTVNVAAVFEFNSDLDDDCACRLRRIA
jgi:hypothetical protein